MSNPLDEISLRLLGIMYFNQNDFGRAIPNLADPFHSNSI